MLIALNCDITFMELKAFLSVSYTA